MLSPITEPLAYDFFLRALLASSMVGVVCAVIGSYMVLRGLAFMGDALSHAAFPGVVVAYLLKGPFYIGATVAAGVMSMATTRTTPTAWSETTMVTAISASRR